MDVSAISSGYWDPTSPVHGWRSDTTSWISYQFANADGITCDNVTNTNTSAISVLARFHFEHHSIPTVLPKGSKFGLLTSTT
jgi:hypothetical protein